MKKMREPLNSAQSFFLEGNGREMDKNGCVKKSSFSGVDYATTAAGS